ncbi:MAG: hypothetical protein KI790_18235 [Cyclobacteriaceae bacterium]|nr:hypothetical protein [Cyclobacteriaceae bacterium HetDA_MAG_MS6]
MNPTAKNLRKLAEVPFFQDFTKDQLNWVDQHTDEYGFGTDEIIPTKGDMETVYWILLYGSWIIENGVETQKLTELGSWFQQASDAADDFKQLKAGSTSYILMVSEKNMYVMKEMGYPIPESII